MPTYVAEEETGLAGFYQIDTRKEPPWLDHLWIDPQYMRQGIGRAPFSNAAALVKGAGHTSLAIDSEPNAEPFYVACGAAIRPRPRTARRSAGPLSAAAAAGGVSINR